MTNPEAAESVQIVLKALIPAYSPDIEPGTAPGYLFLQRANKLGDTWDIPGGRIDDRDQPEPDFPNNPYPAMAREILEETGLDIHLSGKDEPFPLDMQIIEQPGKLRVVRITSAARLIQPGQPNPPKLSDEHRDYRWATLSEALDCLKFDRITDAFLHSPDLTRLNRVLTNAPTLGLAAIRQAWFSSSPSVQRLLP